MTLENRIAIHRYGAFTLIVVILFLLLSAVILPSRGVWQRGLKASVETVLQEKYGSLYTIGEYVHLNSPAGISSAVYRITDVITGQDGYAVILRLTGISGPTAAVYTYFDGDEKGTFAGYAANTHFVSSKDGLNYNASTTQINFCANQIPVIIERGEQE